MSGLENKSIISLLCVQNPFKEQAKSRLCIHDMTRSSTMVLLCGFKFTCSGFDLLWDHRDVIALTFPRQFLGLVPPSWDKLLACGDFYYHRWNKERRVILESPWGWSWWLRASYTATHPCLVLGVFLPNRPVVHSSFSHHRVEGKQALALTQSFHGTQAAYPSHQLWPLSWDACTGLQSSMGSSWTPERWSKQSPGLGLGQTCFMSVPIT